MHRSCTRTQTLAELTIIKLLTNVIFMLCSFPLSIRLQRLRYSSCNLNSIFRKTYRKDHPFWWLLPTLSCRLERRGRRHAYKFCHHCRTPFLPVQLISPDTSDKHRLDFGRETADRFRDLCNLFEFSNKDLHCLQEKQKDWHVHVNQFTSCV